MSEPTGGCPSCGATRDWRGVCPRCFVAASLGRSVSAMGPPPAARLGAFVLLEELGRGGMGRVWRARQDGLEREIALKTLRAGVGADASARERFRREALAAGRLRHPGIVTVHDVGEAEGELYLAMELVRGETLAQRLRTGSLASRIAATLLQHLALAVQHAHEAGVIHRDLKPSNVLLDAEREDAPRLTDFGIARLAGGEEGSAQTLSLNLGPAVNGVRFDRDDGRLLISRSDGWALLWDTVSDSERRRFEHHGDWPTLFDREGRGILQVLARGLARVETGSRRTEYRLPGMALPYFGPVISPDGTRALAGEDSRDVVPNLIHGGHPLNEPTRTRWEIEDAAFSPDGSRLAVCAGTNTALICELGRRPSMGGRIPLGAGSLGLKFTPDSRWLLRMDSAGVLHRVDLSHAPAAVPVPLGIGGIHMAGFSADGSQVAVATDASGLEVRHTRTGNRIVGPWLVKEVHALDLSPDGRWLAAGTGSAVLHWFDLATGQPRTPAIQLDPTAVNPGGGLRITMVAFSPDSRRLAVASYSSRAWLADPVSGQVLHTLEHSAPVIAARFSPDGHRLATACYSGTVQFWNVDTGRPEPLALPGEVLLHDVVWSLQGDRVATAADDGTIRVWSAKSGAMISEVNPTSSMQAVSFHPNGSRLAAVGGVRSGRVWDAESGRPVSEVLTLPLPNSQKANRVGFSPDGSWLAVSQRGGEAYLYRVPLARSPAPSWLPELAETLAGQRIRDDEQLEVIPAADWFERVKRLRMVPVAGEWGHWLAGFLAAEDSWVGAKAPLPASTPGTELPDVDAEKNRMTSVP